jgi:hypothetical protein
MKTKYVNVMKTKYLLATMVALLFSVSSCDKGFVEVNINPQLPASLDPVYSLVSAQIMGTDQHHYEGEICQQIQLLIGGNEEGGNRNTVNTGNMQGRFDFYFGTQVKYLIDVIYSLKDNAARSNLYNMARILKAHAFMILVDTYGDVPYTEAGKAYLAGINLPKYDNQSDIYLDLEKELTEAVNALDASKDVVSQEMYFAGNIPKWKKYGNSLLLRLGMRYTRINEIKASAIVNVAVDGARGGVMASNADNVIVKYNATQTNPANAFAQNSTKHNWFVSQPFINFLKNNNDPRLQYIACLYPDPTVTANPNTTPASQIGCPYGYTDANISTAPNFPGVVGSTFKYSQFNRATVGRVDSWFTTITYAQTSLLLAEARQRGYISTSTVQAYYEAGVKAHMSQSDLFTATSGGASPITDPQATAYLAQPGIAFNVATALQQINEQYWVASLLMWQEAWHNRERSGYPVLTPINFPGQDPYVSGSGGDGFIHRLMYTVKEWSANQVNVQAAADRMGGDNFGTRLFWDPKP